jgi:hypothetical protein
MVDPESVCDRPKRVAVVALDAADVFRAAVDEELAQGGFFWIDNALAFCNERAIPSLRIRTFPEPPENAVDGQPWRRPNDPRGRPVARPRPFLGASA